MMRCPGGAWLCASWVLLVVLLLPLLLLLPPLLLLLLLLVLLVVVLVLVVAVGEDVHSGREEGSCGERTEIVLNRMSRQGQPNVGVG